MSNPVSFSTIYGATRSGLLRPPGRMASEKALPKSCKTSNNVLDTASSNVSDDEIGVFGAATKLIIGREIQFYSVLRGFGLNE